MFVFPFTSNSLVNLVGTLIFSPLLQSCYNGDCFSLGMMQLMSWPEGNAAYATSIFCSLSPLTSCIHSSLFLYWRHSAPSKFFDTDFPLVSTEELVLSCHACCALSHFQCNGHSLLLSSYLSRIGRIKKPSCSTCSDLSQNTCHLILHCLATASLYCSLFGNSLSLCNLWSKPCGIAWLLGLNDLLSCLHFWKGSGNNKTRQSTIRCC